MIVRFRQFGGDVASLTDEGKSQLESAMAQTITVLTNAMTTARQAVDNVGFFTSLTTNIQHDVTGELNQAQTIIDRLQGTDANDVMAGTLDISKWQTGATAVKNGLKGALDDLNQGSASSLLTANFNDQMSSINNAAGKVAAVVKAAEQKVQQVAQDVEDFGKKVKAGAEKALKWGTYATIAGVVIFGGLALWIFLPVIRGTATAYTTAPLRVMNPGMQVGGYKKKKKRRARR